MSQSTSLAVAEHGFDAWRRSDFDALKAIFAPEVERLVATEDNRFACFSDSRR